MRKAILAACAATFVLLTGCADDPYFHPYRQTAPGYDLYYDNFYGAIDDGYWGDDSFFYYRLGSRGGYLRDDGRHIRRDAAPGYSQSHFHDGRRP